MSPNVLKLKVSLSPPLSLAPAEQIRGRRPRREALQLPAHAPQPRRQETALYWGKTRLLLPLPRHPAAHLGPRSHAAWAGPTRGGGGAAEGFNNRTIALRQHSCRNLNSRQSRLSPEQPPSETRSPSTRWLVWSQPGSSEARPPTPLPPTGFLRSQHTTKGRRAPALGASVLRLSFHT